MKPQRSHIKSHLRQLSWFRTMTLCCFFACLSGLQSISAELRAGFARLDITPERPVRLAGYESRKEPSKGVHDPLSVRALAFEKDGKHLVLLSVDNLGFYNGTAEPLRRSIIERCGLESAELFLCAIHTHSAPTLTLSAKSGHENNESYTRALQSNLVLLVQTAQSRLAPIELSIGRGSSPVGVNRREPVEDNNGQRKTVLGRNPAVETDREVQVMKLLRPGQQQPAALLFAYATHSTSLGWQNYLISGDIHGLAEQFLERYYGPDLVAAGFAGASGDIDPWVRVLPDFRTNNGWVPEPVLMGTMLGEEVARVLEKTTPASTEHGINTVMKAVALPAKEEGATSLFNVTIARLGETVFVGWGGEVFNAFGKELKMASPFKPTFVFTHCNGTAGYVPTRETYPEGGYEVQTSSFGPGAGELLVKETLRMLKDL